MTAMAEATQERLLARLRELEQRQRQLEARLLVVNDIVAAINTIEEVLGVQPQGDTQTVGDRIARLERRPR